VLIVDDDAEIRTLLATYLGRNGFKVSAVGDGRAMWRALEATRFDLVVLDLMLPGEDGLTLCRDLRAKSDIPVVMLTARGEETDRIVGLEMGADDYLPKPFSARELMARIKVILRRAQPARQPAARQRPAPAVRRLGAGHPARQLESPDGVVVALSGAGKLLRCCWPTPTGCSTATSCWT
jgi:two-component system OmpR family response regulator